MHLPTCIKKYPSYYWKCIHFSLCVKSNAFCNGNALAKTSLNLHKKITYSPNRGCLCGFLCIFYLTMKKYRKWVSDKPCLIIYSGRPDTLPCSYSSIKPLPSLRTSHQFLNGPVRDIWWGIQKRYLAIYIIFAATRPLGILRSHF